MHRITGVVVPALAALLIVSSAVAATAKATGTQPIDRPAKADVARAKATVLLGRDVFSNFTRDATLKTAPTIAHCGNYPGDRSDITVTGSARSAFRLNSYSIGSSALWFKTAGDADRYWTKTVRKQYVQCLAEGLQFTDAEGKIVKPRIAQAEQIQLRNTGAEQAVAYRVIGGVTGTGIKSFNWIETAVFVKHGRSIALLRTIWINSFCSCYHDLAKLLAKRLKAHG